MLFADNKKIKLLDAQSREETLNKKVNCNFGNKQRNKFNRVALRFHTSKARQKYYLPSFLLQSMDESAREFECKSKFFANCGLLDVARSDDETTIRACLFAGGILLFLGARKIAHKAFTFYASSAFIGVFLSVVFLAMFMRRFLPKASDRFFVCS